jgi:hypothetical protein
VTAPVIKEVTEASLALAAAGLTDMVWGHAALGIRGNHPRGRPEGYLIRRAGREFYR